MQNCPIYRFFIRHMRLFCIFRQKQWYVTTMAQLFGHVGVGALGVMVVGVRRIVLVLILILIWRRRRIVSIIFTVVVAMMIIVLMRVRLRIIGRRRIVKLFEVVIFSAAGTCEGALA